MIQDLHSHTYYSFCGKDKPETIVEAAIAGGMELFGISDHCYGIGYAKIDAYFCKDKELTTNYGNNLIKYFDHINLIKEKYASKIKVLRGIEIATLKEPERLALPDSADVSFFDYCLIEHIDSPDSVVGDKIFEFADRCGCPTKGIAHTDLFSFIKNLKQDPYKFFKKMADNNIFWEMNVSYDSIHNYNQHAYMLNFFENPEQQAIIKESGVRLSVGFDGHRVEDYLPDRIKSYCKRINDMGIKLAFEK